MALAARRQDPPGPCPPDSVGRQRGIPGTFPCITLTWQTLGHDGKADPGAHLEGKQLQLALGKQGLSGTLLPRGGWLSWSRWGGQAPAHGAHSQKRGALASSLSHLQLETDRRGRQAGAAKASHPSDQGPLQFTAGPGGLTS